MPTLRRCHVASAIDTLRAHRLARTGKHADPRRHRRLCPSTAANPRLNRPEKLPGCSSGAAQQTPLPSATVQPNPQIPISLRPHTAGSFFGDFRTPSGIRNSSRNRTVPFGVNDGESRLMSIARADARSEPIVTRLSIDRAMKTLLERLCQTLSAADHHPICAAYARASSSGGRLGCHSRSHSKLMIPS
jgi:hypothetical protein